MVPMAEPEAPDYPPAKRSKHLHQLGPITGHNVPTQAPVAGVTPGLSSSFQSPEHAGNWPPDNRLFDPTWSWQSSPTAPPQQAFSERQHEVTVFQNANWESISPSARNNGTLAPMVPVCSEVTTQSHRLPRLLPAASDTSPVPTSSHPQDQRRRKTRVKTNLVSPFKDCIETFGKFSRLHFTRPQGGSVNGYVKFNWKGNGAAASQPASIAQSPIDKADSPTHSTHLSTALQPVAAGLPADLSTTSLALSSALVNGPQLPPGTVSVALSISPQSARSSISLNAQHLGLSSSDGVLGLPFSIQNTSTTFPNDFSLEMELYPDNPFSVELVSVGSEPQYPPPQFGFDAHIKNWCPGRTILDDSNLWLKDFARMHSNDGVRAAIQSLAGIYIYDYMPTDAIRKRVNLRFTQAEARFSQLLNSPNTPSHENANEIITLSVLLSMQDIILTERRLKKPFIPRWLQGFRHGEHFLQATDQGTRFWDSNNVQTDTLHNAHCIMIGRGIILSQTMMVLPAPANFDPEQEAARFGWLLYGSPADMYEIHGGCGFCKKLLHVFSRITYCAARLQQERESPFVPVHAEFLLRELSEMRQWSKPPIEVKKNNPLPQGPAAFDWESAKARQSTIQWVRSLPLGFQVESAKDMTDVTAEAWRIAAMIYLQCRVLRLARNDTGVTQNLGDLARCIEVMPTSGYYFTAQAPLFPVFLLGLTATETRHKQVAEAWFLQVVETPVRSSVPPLYDALQRIWAWMASESDFAAPASQSQTQNSPIYKRRPWWERLVSRIQEKEEETLCLT
ncbi:hypothetical protein HJFPF1_08893 [Paramyrothecium foliicola]|nr:hypothetical protein HJFPF1_08893 [Paramyrothecium foliicola]